MLLREQRRTRVQREKHSVPTVRLYRSHRVRERTECFRETTDCSKSVSQRTTGRVHIPSLATRADQPPCFVLPSCCFPRAQLSHSIHLSASIAELSAGPKLELGKSEPSVRGARSFTPSAKRVVAAAFSRDRFGVNAGHCLKTRCFLRRPTAKRAGVDYLIGTGLASARRDLLLEPGAEPFRLEVVPTSRSEAALGCITLGGSLQMQTTP